MKYYTSRACAEKRWREVRRTRQARHHGRLSLLRHRPRRTRRRPGGIEKSPYLRGSALRQRRHNLGHALVLPTSHATSLYDMSSDLRAELFDEVARVARVMAAHLGAHGSTILQNNDSPDQVLFHVHVHVVPRYPGDAYLTPSGPPGLEIPRETRVEQAAALHAALRRG
ncbi:HIT domain-containing protein [Actinopolymorpha pittospori]